LVQDDLEITGDIVAVARDLAPSHLQFKRLYRADLRYRSDVVDWHCSPQLYMAVKLENTVVPAVYGR
jgi:hypothetical protein